MAILEALTSIGPAIVAIASPGNAVLAGEIGQITQAGLGSFPNT